MSRSLSDNEVERTKHAFRRLLGRDLSPEEERYIGLSCVIVSLDDLELNRDEERPRLKVVGED